MLFDKIQNFLCSVLSCKAKVRAEQQYTDASDSKEQGLSFDDWLKVELRIGRVQEASKLEGSDKLIKSVVDFGELGRRVVVSGIANQISPEELEGNKYIYITNLPARKIFGVVSEAMILAAEDKDGTLALARPDKDVQEGSRLS